MLGPYASFIVTSYALVMAVVLMMIAWIIVDYRRQQARLRELEASGVVRRSGRWSSSSRSPAFSCCGSMAAIPQKFRPP